jgi:hypothetical protein
MEKCYRKDKLPYTQLIDPNGFDAKTALLFGIEQLPSSYLFDESGILIAINPTLEEISIQLKNKIMKNIPLKFILVACLVLITNVKSFAQIISQS